MKNTKLNKLTFILIVIGLLVSCGGGGGGSDPQPPPTPTPPVDTSSSDWDGMVWDQDDWG